MIQSVLAKDEALLKVMREKNIDPGNVIFMGNDTNDLAAFNVVGFCVAPADAHPEVLRKADLLLSRKGGRGAVRELCDLILLKFESED